MCVQISSRSHEVTGIKDRACIECKITRRSTRSLIIVAVIKLQTGLITDARASNIFSVDSGSKFQRDTIPSCRTFILRICHDRSVYFLSLASLRHVHRIFPLDEKSSTGGTGGKISRRSHVIVVSKSLFLSLSLSLKF